MVLSEETRDQIQDPRRQLNVSRTVFLLGQRTSGQIKERKRSGLLQVLQPDDKKKIRMLVKDKVEVGTWPVTKNLNQAPESQRQRKSLKDYLQRLYQEPPVGKTCLSKTTEAPSNRNENLRQGKAL